MSDGAVGVIGPEDWLATIDADSPILLVAPHGGRAGAASRKTLHPKVNDLYTAEITRDLARRLGAAALINFAMDRNQLDVNRLTQVAQHAPWLLEMLADRLTQITARYGRAIVLMIHGWNIIEPRVDFGLGLKTIGGELRPAGSARVSASDAFIRGPLMEFAARLREAGVIPTFGMRYPAGALHNLVQAFTERHRTSQVVALRRLSDLAARGVVDAAQLELSVAVRMPGNLRERCIAALVAALETPRTDTLAPYARMPVVRETTPPPARPMRAVQTVTPTRVGIEFFDLGAGIGGMASFDLSGGFGARIMILSSDRRVALCTCEGRVRLAGDKISLGPLELQRDGREIVLRFAGPAVIVPDGSAYLSIERALASGQLDPAAQVSLRMQLSDHEFDPAAILGDPGVAPDSHAGPFFAPISGVIRLGGTTTSVHAAARAGLSFTGLGPQKFRERRMIWARFDDGGDPSAIELRTVTGDATPTRRAAMVLHGATIREAMLDRLEIETPVPDQPPARIFARTASGGESLSLEAKVCAYVPLSRPGPDSSRIFTTIGFAEFHVAERVASGMFEHSRVVVADDTARSGATPE